MLERVSGTGEPVGPLRHREPDPHRRHPPRGRRATRSGPALPRLQPAPPPPLPTGTALVEVDDDDPDMHDLEGPVRPDYRRAAGA